LKPWYLLGALAVLLLAGYWQLRRTPFDWMTFAANFRHVDWAWASAGIVFIFLTYFVRAMRWEVMIKPLNTGLGLGTLFAYTLIGFTAVVLFGRPGEIVRPYLIATRAKVPISTQLAAWLIERILDLVMVLLIFGGALSQIDKGVADPGPRLQLILRLGGWLIGLLAGASLVLLLGFRHFRGRARERILAGLEVLPSTLHGKFDAFLLSFSEGMESLRSRGAITALVGYSVLEWVVIGVSFLSIFRAFPATAHLSITDVVITLGFVAFGSAVQIPGIGGGMQVAAVFVLTELYQLPLESAGGVALALWLVNYVAIVPAGLTVAFHQGLNWHKLRHLGEEADKASVATTNKV
jgi:glycosyltransferase 2 family protein